MFYRTTMSFVIYPTSLYKFLKIAKEQNVEKTVLDCGAGGKRPPLALFYLHGFKATGIDISNKQIKLAKGFEEVYEMELDIKEADMRDLPFSDESFGCVFTYNSSIHLTKKDTEKSIKEMLRVLKKDGLLYINFIMNIEGRTELGEEKNPGEFWMDIEGEDVIHSIYSDNEPDIYFKDTTIIFKEKRTFTVNNGSKHYTDGYIEYIVKK